MIVPSNLGALGALGQHIDGAVAPLTTNELAGRIVSGDLSRADRAAVVAADFSSASWWAWVRVVIAAAGYHCERLVPSAIMGGGEVLGGVAMHDGQFFRG
jgi:hypothetical protein